jgi:hypothetical protein
MTYPIKKRFRHLGQPVSDAEGKRLLAAYALGDTEATIKQKRDSPPMPNRRKVPRIVVIILLLAILTLVVAVSILMGLKGFDPSHIVAAFIGGLLAILWKTR